MCCESNTFGFVPWWRLVSCVQWKRLCIHQTNLDTVLLRNIVVVSSVNSSLRLWRLKLQLYTAGHPFPLHTWGHRCSCLWNKHLLSDQMYCFVFLREIQFCAPYNGTTCRDYLQGRMVVHSGASLMEADSELLAHLRYIEELGLFSSNRGNANICEGPARRLLCHMTFPDCYNETSRSVPICQWVDSSFLLFMLNFCFHYCTLLCGVLFINCPSVVGLYLLSIRILQNYIYYMFACWILLTVPLFYNYVAHLFVYCRIISLASADRGILCSICSRVVELYNYLLTSSRILTIIYFNDVEYYQLYIPML